MLFRTHHHHNDPRSQHTTLHNYLYDDALPAMRPASKCMSLSMQVQWFERRGSLPASVGASMHEAEVVESDLIDTNLVGCLDSRALILTANSYEEVRLAGEGGDGRERGYLVVRWWLGSSSKVVAGVNATIQAGRRGRPERRVFSSRLLLTPHAAFRPAHFQPYRCIAY